MTRLEEEKMTGQNRVVTETWCELLLMASVAYSRVVT